MKINVYIMSACLSGRGGMEMAIRHLNYLLNNKYKEIECKIILFGGNEKNLIETFNGECIFNDIYKSGILGKFVSKKNALNYMKSIIDKNDTEKNIFMATDPWTLDIANKLCNTYKLSKSIFWSHFNINVYTDSKFWIYNKLNIKKADRVYVLNNYSKNKLTEELAIKNVKVIPNSVDFNNVNTIKYKKGEFYYVGRIDNNTKNLDLIFDILPKLRGDWGLNVIGSGADLIKYKSYIKDNNLENRVKFHGWSNDPWNLIKEGSFLILPTKNEGFGIVLIEAIVRNLPVIVNKNANGPIDIVQNGVNGFSFENKEELLSIMQGEIDCGYNQKIKRDNLCDTIKKFNSENVIKEIYSDIKSL